ncbi:MAG TPA: hypothetical protein VG737_07460, partial [Cyclobacteriaceae bacterium]|nr:hypothetical protein [Cyclobacteriaceae bacterium]
VSWGGDNRTNLVDLVKGTSTEIEEFKEGDFPEMSPDGMMMSTQVGKKRKSKTYDFSTGKVVAGHFQEMQKINTKRSYWASVGEKTFTNWPSQKAYPMKYGSTPGVPAQLVWDDADRIIVWENKNDRNYSKYENFVVVYNRNTGEVIKEIPLNRSQEEAKKIREAEEEAQRKRQAEADAARQEKMANAKPGFKKFDASFRDLGLPFTMDYNSAQGFSLGGDAFINSDMGLRSGSEIYGMGRICSCNDNSTYLLMVRNKTSTTDLSNFIIVSFDIGGNRVGSRTIGATQKDPSGITRLDFTISNAYCGAQVKAATTYSNGNKEDKSFSFGGCRVN